MNFSAIFKRSDDFSLSIASRKRASGYLLSLC